MDGVSSLINRIMQIYKGKDGFKQMLAVRAPAHDVQKEIELGRGGQAKQGAVGQHCQSSSIMRVRDTAESADEARIVPGMPSLLRLSTRTLQSYSAI